MKVEVRAAGLMAACAELERERTSRKPLTTVSGIPRPLQPTVTPHGDTRMNTLGRRTARAIEVSTAAQGGGVAT